MEAPSLSNLPSPPADRSGWPWTEQSSLVPNKMADGSEWPAISIVTPSYNQGPYLEKTIRSVLLQRFPNLEYIIVDGGSTDETVQILEKYDPWIDYWESTEDRGQSHAINKGFSQASGTVLAWLNSDDWYARDALKSVSEAFIKAPETVGAVVGKGHMVDSEENIVYTPTTTELTREAFLDWMEYGHFVQPACFFKRPAWDAAGPIREDLTYCFDVALWLEMSGCVDFHRVDQTLAFALKHEEAKTIAHRNRSRGETIVVVAEHGGSKIALKEMHKLVNRLESMESKVRRFTNHPIYKVYKRLKNVLTPS